jgi:peptidoglycan/LPS O-acetylase OafA/YrhL
LRSTEAENRIPALTGIRGIAVLMVMFLHFLPEAIWPEHAWVKRAFQTAFGSGVDLFFVLSGFLITGILIDTKENPHYFRNFFARRVLRIFPLYYGTLAVIFGLLPALGLLGGPSFEPVRQLSPWHWAYLSNVAWVWHPHGLDSPQIDLRHFWSLSVEEHFYLVWPFVVAFVSRRAVLRLCAGLLLFSLSLRLLLLCAPPGNVPQNIIFFTPFHLDGLAAGGFLAALTRGPDWRNWLTTAKIAFMALSLAIGALLLGMEGHATLARSLGLSLLSVVLACGVFIVLATPEGRLSRALSRRPLQFFGNYSYGLYVIHGLLAPVLISRIADGPWITATGSVFLGGVLVTLARVAVVIPLALASWRFYENPILGLKQRFQ